MQNWSELIFTEEISFVEKARHVFKYQFEHNAIYRRYCEALGYPSDRTVQSDGLKQIPLLPVKAFKDALVTTKPDDKPALTFKSSGTSNMQRSVHQIHDPSLYDKSLLRGFGHFYDLDSSVTWGYTPGYAENPDSSLIYMIQKLIDQDRTGLSRFMPLDKPIQNDDIAEVQQSGKKLILFGAAFGLMDLLDTSEVKLPSNSIIIETGGMKTHKRAISKNELHWRLAEGFGLDKSRIHSEYGMCELLSQAYAIGGRWFRTVPWMSVSIRNPENPYEESPPHEEGLIGIIDLANVHSCSFILTGDKGLADEEGRFQVLGRWNPKDLRGCNFLIDED